MCGLPGTHVLLDTPKVVVPLYIRFIHPGRGFGMFTGKRMDNESAIQVDLNVPTTDCIGTYGGRICDKREAIHKKAVYRMWTGSIDPLDLNAPYVYTSPFCALTTITSQGTQSAHRRLRHARWRRCVHQQQLLSKRYA